MYTVLLDAPDQAERRVQIAKLGDFKDKRYGEFSITRADAEAWAANLKVLPGGQALVDLEHRSERAPRDSRAAGWIRSIDIDGDRVLADIEWTPLGEQEIKSRSYRFMSPTFGRYTDETGTVHENTLVSAALTNKPFLNMPAVCLASEERLSEALAEDPASRFYQLALDGQLGEETQRLATTFGVDSAKTVKTGSDGADSRRSMDTQILTALGLDADADDAKILDAVTALKDKAAAAPQVETETRSLEEQAAEVGKKLLDAGAFTQLVSDAAAGRQAAEQLHEERRDRVWTRALEQMVRVSAQHDHFLKMYELDAEGTAAAIEDDIANGRRLLNAKPIGQNAEVDQLNPDQQFAQRIDEKRKELNCSYEAAYVAVLDEMEVKV